MQCGEDSGKKIGSARRLIALAGAFARISLMATPQSKQTSADYEKRYIFLFRLVR